MLPLSEVTSNDKHIFSTLWACKKMTGIMIFVWKGIYRLSQPRYNSASDRQHRELLDNHLLYLQKLIFR